MSEPIVAQKTPYEVELEPGSYWWCACGLSKSQPFCDGSHKDTDLNPVELKVDKKEKLWLCGCKASSTPPYCDGAHKTLIP